ncbi:carbohydrate kinase family protein [bacterium]|nr:MAG: carbohydrate kinase family protein [bacterium]
MSERAGIIGAGNWIVDHIKVVDVYPAEQSLANIRRESISNGGAPFNVLKDLSRLGARFPLKGFGLVGDDNDSGWIREECRNNRIDTGGLKSAPGIHTSYTDVMSVENTGRRTFFHQRGANALFGVEPIDVHQSTAKLFHLGYLLLLDELDKMDSHGVTGAARLLKAAQETGLITSVDTVSEESNRFNDIIVPSLPYVDLLFMNEFEASRCTGLDLCNDIPDREILRDAAKQLLRHGVNQWVLIHFPKGVFALSKQGEEILQGAVQVPGSRIMSTVGAGDAFAAGTLWGIHEGWDMHQSVRLGVCTAAACLQDISCSDGIRDYEACLALGDTYSFHELHHEHVEKGVE